MHAIACPAAEVLRHKATVNHPVLSPTRSGWRSSDAGELADDGAAAFVKTGDKRFLKQPISPSQCAAA